MSDASNQIILIWQDVEAQLSRHTFSYQNEPLSEKNNVLIRDSYSLWYLATYDSLISEGVTPSSLDIRWIHLLCSTDVLEVASFLKMADSILLRNESTSYEDFKHLLGKEYPFAGRLLSPMKEIIVRWFDFESIHCFSTFHSWLSFISRVNLTLDVLEAKALEDYLAIESSFSDDRFTSEEGDLISAWFPVLRGYDFYQSVEPKNGSGSTADAGRHLIDKYLSMSDDARLRYLGGDFSPYQVKKDQLERSCKLVFVPKSLTGYRSISMEPASLMWYQQGILKGLVDYIHKSPLRKRFVPEDQQPNRDLAWEGSINGSFATIDLSSASDSVAWSTIRMWFRHTFLLRWLLCTRSSSVKLPTGEVMGLKKFAPMGSALCFPIECIVFSAITECAIRESGGNPVSSRYRVYGDDIVVETQFAQAVIDRLIRNGFTVNRKKTFCDHSDTFTFRESCGGEYLNGADVTPTRLSRRFAGLRVSIHRPSQILALIDLANDCNSRYPSVRRRCIASVESLPCKLRPLFNSTGEGGIFSTNPTNWHLPACKWSQDYQAWYQPHGHSSMKFGPKHGLEVEGIRLFEYLRQADGRQRLLYPEDRVDVHLRRQIAGIWTLTSSPAEGHCPSLEYFKTS